MDILDKVPKEYQVKGTEFVELETLSKALGGTWVAQIRMLTGRHLHLFLRKDGAWSRLAKKEADQLTDEEMMELTAGSLERSREMLHHGVVRLLEITDEGVKAYPLTVSPIGEHSVEEVSVDLFQGDYAAVIPRIMKLSEVYTGEAAPAEPFRDEHEGATGRPGAEVRGEAARVD